VKSETVKMGGERPFILRMSPEYVIRNQKLIVHNRFFKRQFSNFCKACEKGIRWEK